MNALSTYVHGQWYYLAYPESLQVSIHDFATSQYHILVKQIAERSATNITVGKTNVMTWDKSLQTVAIPEQSRLSIARRYETLIKKAGRMAYWAARHQVIPLEFLKCYNHQISLSWFFPHVRYGVIFHDRQARILRNENYPLKASKWMWQWDRYSRWYFLTRHEVENDPRIKLIAPHTQKIFGQHDGDIAAVIQRRFDEASI